MNKGVKMNKLCKIIFAVVVFFSLNLQADEYFVSQKGEDTNSGKSRTEAFKSITKGVETIQAGDILTILPGEYYEAVRRENFGSTEKDTIIRAAIPGTVVVRGDKSISGFEKVAGYKFVYSCIFAEEPQALLEYDSLKVLAKKPNISELEFMSGSFFYDKENKKLYLSTADQESPEGRRFTAAVLGKTGLHFEKPVRLIIDGLAFSGAYFSESRKPGRWAQWQWGVMLNQPKNCRIKNCTSFLNFCGIGMANGSGNVIENCRSYGNAYINIAIFGGDNNRQNTVKGCYSYKGGTGIDYYGRIHGPVYLKDNIAWGNRLDYSNKSGNNSSSLYGAAENCIGLGEWRIKNLRNCIIGGKNEYRRDADNPTPVDNIILMDEEELDFSKEFADHINMDFRLQGASRFRGKSWDFKDRGAFPEFKENVFYVSNNGNDKNDGLSVDSSWQNLDYALTKIKSGDTLYIEGGDYNITRSLDKKGNAKEPLFIRGRGYGKVSIAGDFSIKNIANINIERIKFTGNLKLVSCEKTVVKNCTFTLNSSLALSACDKSELRNNVFKATSVSFIKSKDIVLTGNYFNNKNKSNLNIDNMQNILYADYNAYSNAEKCWSVNGKTLSFSDIKEKCEYYSRVMTEEKFNVKVDSISSGVKGMGPLATAIGPYQEYVKPATSLVGPFLHSVSSNSANFEWWSSQKAVRIRWGETPDMKNSISRVYLFDYKNISLTDLKPGKKYYLKIDSLGEDKEFTAEDKVSSEIIEFTTLQNVQKIRNIYVANSGDDKNTGIDKSKPLSSIAKAADLARPGDTVIISGGTYNEMIRIRVTGTEKQPITFKAATCEKVVIEGDLRRLSQAFVMNGKSNIHFDGFYFKNFSGPVFYAENCENIKITRCFSDGRVPGYAGGLISAKYCLGTIVKNCVVINAMGGAMQFIASPDTRIENNVFLRNLIFAGIFVNEPDQKLYFQKNIVTDNLPTKTVVALFEIGKVESFVEGDNCYFLRIPDDKRKIFQLYGDEAYGRSADFYDMKKEFETPSAIKKLTRMSLANYQEKFGKEGSIVGDPLFKGNEGMEKGGTLWTGHPTQMFDKLMGIKDMDFPDLFATRKDIVEKDIGLQREAFADFHFNKK